MSAPSISRHFHYTRMSVKFSCYSVFLLVRLDSSVTLCNAQSQYHEFDSQIAHEIIFA